MRARLIPDAVLDEIRDRTDLVGFIGDYIPLKKSGRSYKGLCPFHTEKTPSFNVSPDRNIFRCFGCGAGGNVFTFVMQMDGMSFLEAVRYLAKRAGVEVPATTPEEASDARRRERLLKVTSRAATLYHRQLLEAPEADGARRYLADRGLTDAAIKDFELGYAPAGWDFLLKKAQTSGVSTADLEAVGLVIRSERGGGHYDRFRARLIFPIRDHRGEVVGFGGRLLDPDATEAKYINTPETALYHKGRLLYGMDKARREAQDCDELLVTEGYLDVITAHQEGLGNIVATLGTALTEQHARLIGRYAKRVTLVFDADQAGLNAARRGADLLLAQGLQVEVLALPDGHDPDSYIRSSGMEAFEVAHRQAKPLVDFFLDELLKDDEADSPARKGRVASELLPLVSRIPNHVERDEAFRHMADALGVREEALRDEFRRQRAEARRHPVKGPGAEPVVQETPWPEEELLLRILLQDRAAMEAVSADLAPESLKDGSLRAICRALFEVSEVGEVDLARIVDHLPDAELAARAVQLAETPHGLEDYRVGLRDSMATIESRALRGQVRELERALREAEVAGNDSMVHELTLRRMELQRGLPV
ncbi:MAG: DNA primase [Nitrospinae bacterium]|nr:DNA primase [Nitrospinota bacterium]